MTMMLQRFLLPNLDLCPQSELYVNCGDGSWYSHAQGEVRLRHGSSAHFDTYFNGFSVGKWRRHTGVEHIVFRFEARGDFEAELVLNHAHRATHVVAAVVYGSETRAWFELEPPSLEAMVDGHLYLKIRGLGPETVIFGGEITTDDEPAREVSVGVVITTYNRPGYLARNLTRLAEALRDEPGYANRLEILVVDNGRNVDVALPAMAPITVVPNKNLGGAGGFARGLMHFRDGGEVSHVLFMDDDITFEPEVIFRTIELLSYARDPQLCVAGAMLMEEEPYVQFESGASFQTEGLRPFRPIGSHLDLRDWRNLVENDVERPAGYGAWWYFAFPLALAEANPLPVFVRGDDVCFGLRHTGQHTVTMNGIGVWHQHFAQKNGPAAFYYESRNLALVSVLASDRFSAFHLTRRFVYHTTRMALAMKYDTAEADIDGMRQFLAGPDAWLELDHEEVNQDIRQHPGERSAPLDRESLGVPAFKPRWPVGVQVGGLLSALVLSGHALPARLCRRPSVALEMAAWSPYGVLGREEVVYRYQPTGEGFVTRRDRKRFFSILDKMARTAACIPGQFDQLKEDYRAAYPVLTGDDYWLRQFGDHAAPADVLRGGGPS